jgi:radical SAM protein
MEPDKPHTRDDFAHSPLLVFYETTRACDLMCRHCRADAQRQRDPAELTTLQARRLIAELTIFPKPPLLVFTGGDPLKREDVFALVGHAADLGLKTAMTPSATPLVTAEAIARLQGAGLGRLAVSLDGATKRTHDRFRRVAGSFVRTLRIIEDARRCGLPVQVNTTVATHNLGELDAMAQVLASLPGVVMWSVFFLVPTGRACGPAAEAGGVRRLTADEVEAAFETLWRQSGRQPYAIKTTEAPHYRRFVAQKLAGRRREQRAGRGTDALAGTEARLVPDGRHFVGTNDGKGVVFVGHTGEIYPSGFLPIHCGRFPFDSVVHVYRKAALFEALRDPDRLGGKCGACEFRNICGGSRGRAFAVSGDPLAEEPDCAYVPLGWAGRSGKVAGTRATDRPAPGEGALSC